MSRVQESPFLFTGIKAVFFVLLAVFVLLQMVGQRQSSTSFAEMQSAVTTAAEMEKMQEADNQMIKRLYGIDPGAYEGVCLYYPLTNMGAEELFLVKFRDPSQMEEAKAAIEARLAVQKKSFDGYGIEQSAMLARSVTDVRPGFALFVSAENTGSVENAFDKAY